MKNRTIVNISTMFLFASLSLYANQMQQFNQQQPKQVQSAFTGEYPLNKKELSVPPSVQRIRFQLGIKPTVINSLRDMQVKEKKVLNGTYNLSILQNPLYKRLRSVDTLYFNPNYINTIIFPKNLKIVSAMASFSTRSFSKTQNMLIVQPTNKVTTGNILISLTNGNKNFIMNIYVDIYYPNAKSCKITKSIHYLCDGHYLATMIKYVPTHTLSVQKQFEVIRTYLLVNNLKKLTIKRNLGYVSIKIKGIRYYIIRDDQFGTIFRNGLKLRVTETL